MKQETLEIINWIKMHIWVQSDDKEGFVKWKLADDFLDSIPKMMNCDKCKPCPECGKRKMTDMVRYRGVSKVAARLGIDGETLAKAGLCKNISYWGYKVGDIIRRKGEAEVSMITAIRGGTHDGHVFAFGEWIEDLTQYELVKRDSWERWG